MRNFLKILFTAVCVMFYTACNDDNNDPVREPSIEMELTDNGLVNPTHNSITVEMIPNEYTTSYRYAIGLEEDEDQDKKAFAAGNIPGTETVSGKERRRVILEGLMPETRYVIYAMASDGEKWQSNVSTLKERTMADETEARVTLTLSGIPSENEFKVIFTPNSNTTGFSYAIGKSTDLAAFENGTLTGITPIDNAVSQTIAFPGLDSGTDYTVFARAMNEEEVYGRTATLNVTTAR